MNEQDALLHAVCAEPDDDDARLRHAEWLEKHGDPLGTFIKWQLSRSGERLFEKPQVKQTEQMLWRQHRDEWEKPWRELGVIGTIDFRRGYAEHIIIPCDQFLQHQDKLFALGPIQSVTLLRCGPQQIAAGSRNRLATAAADRRSAVVHLFRRRRQAGQAECRTPQ